MRPGTPSGPAASWLGVRCRASCMVAGVIHLEIIGVEAACVGWMCPSQKKEAPGGSVGSRDRATVSICVILAITSCGAVMMRPVVSSRITERSTCGEGVSIIPSVVRILNLSAALGFLINRRSKALPYRMRRRLRTWRMSIQVTLLRPLKHV
jgi:hypothetical protein